VYKGVSVYPACFNSAGIRWDARISGDSRFGTAVPPLLRAGTKDSMRELIRHYLGKRNA
jgi:hypothetical protein